MHVVPLDGTWDGAEVALRLARFPGLAWLDGNGSGTLGRWSFIGTAPAQVQCAHLEAREPLRAVPDTAPSHGETELTLPIEPDSVPRWIGYVAYDAALSWGTRSGRNRRGLPPRFRTGMPVVWFGRYDALVAIDSAAGRAFIVGDDVDACARLRARVRDAPPRPRDHTAVGRMTVDAPWIHRAAIERALEHIAAGDIYQVNLARRWSAPFTGSALELWLAMRRASPVPLGFYQDAGDHAVLAASMERFLRWDASTRALETRPIKGTIARGIVSDEQAARRLLADDKERAEHAMIVDLMRNDIGRVAEVGSVAVNRVMDVEPYARLLHLVSTVSCRTRAGVGVHEILDATFPPGSVTGAPKERAVEIIEALEPHARGVYTGAVGYVDRAGGLSLAVAIRTAVVAGGAARYFAGGGLVSASVPDNEVAETELKARVFLDALAQLDVHAARALTTSRATRVCDGGGRASRRRMPWNC